MGWLEKQTVGQLQDVDLDEISGVDAGAHGVRGWLLMKSKEADFRSMNEEEIGEFLHEELGRGTLMKLKTRKAASPALQELLDALKSAEGELDDAPDEVKRGAQSVFAWVSSEAEASDEDDEALSDAIGKSADPLGTAIRATLTGRRVVLK